MGHSLASATLGLVGQPKLQKYIQKELGENYGFGRSASGLVSSAVVSPIYVVVTIPLSRLEVIMQTNSIKGKSIPVTEAIKEMARDMSSFGIMKAVISLTLFHEGRMWCQDQFKDANIKNGF